MLYYIDCNVTKDKVKEVDIMEWIPNYDEKVLKKLKSIKLNQEQQNELERCMKEVKWYVKDAFEDIYKLYVSEKSPKQIAEYFNKSQSTIQTLFKKLGIQRTLKEAQIISAKNKDYYKIRKTFKKTMKERFIKNQLFGSEIENLIRVELNQQLNDLLDNNYEVIIGMNSMFDIGELDIPIIIISVSGIYKFGVEVGNSYLHKNKKLTDKLKISEFKKIGYRIFKLDTTATIRNDGSIGNYGDLQESIKIICNNIINIVKK